MAGMSGDCRCKEKITKEVAKYGVLEPALCLELKKITQALAIPGKGIMNLSEFLEYSTDESTTLESEKNGSAPMINFLENILSSPEVDDCISGVSLSPEIALEKFSDERELIEHLQEKKIVPGTKVDKGTTVLFGTLNETTTQGLDGLQEICINLKKQGFHFTTWKCCYKISDLWPSRLAIIENTNVSARYASTVQSARMVPIIDSEILSEGDDSINRSQEVHRKIFSHLFKALIDHHVYLDGVILKNSLVRPGKKNAAFIEHHMIAEYTINVLRQIVPPAVPAVFFSIDSQSIKDYLLDIDAINKIEGKKPWILSFCFEGTISNQLPPESSTKNDEIHKSPFSRMMKSLTLYSQASLGRSNPDEIQESVKNGKEFQ